MSDNSVISTRVRLQENLKDFSFPLQAFTRRNGKGY